MMIADSLTKIVAMATASMRRNEALRVGAVRGGEQRRMWRYSRSYWLHLFFALDVIFSSLDVFVHRTTVEGRSFPLLLYCIRCRAGVGVNVLPCFVFFSLLLLRSNSPLVFVLESDFGGGVNEGICFRILSMGFLFWLSRKHSLVPRMPFVIPVWLHRSAVVSCHESVH